MVTQSQVPFLWLHMGIVFVFNTTSDTLAKCLTPLPGVTDILQSWEQGLGQALGSCRGVWARADAPGEGQLERTFLLARVDLRLFRGEGIGRESFLRDTSLFDCGDCQESRVRDMGGSDPVSGRQTPGTVLLLGLPESHLPLQTWEDDHRWTGPLQVQLVRVGP